MADESLIEKVHELSDLELAILLCLISREHCLISTPDHVLNDLVEELQLVAAKTFGLTSIVIDCTPSTTLDDFTSAILVPSQSRSSASSPITTRSDSYFSPRSSSSHHQHRRSSYALQLSRRSSSSYRIENFVIARSFDRAPAAVQIQALELLRTGRIFTRTSVQVVPKPFIFVPTLSAASGGEARVARHLNDHFYVAHWHDPELGFVNLDEEESGGGEAGDGDSDSARSVLQKSPTIDAPQQTDALITADDIARLASLGQQVAVDIDVTRYRMNIVAFLRMHRAVAEGVTPTSVKHFERLSRSLAPLHNLDYVTPALVDLAARRTFLHRILITSPEKERSVQWGSKLETVKSVLEHVGPEEVIEDVLTMVTAPL